jgi:hypothetical protein
MRRTMMLTALVSLLTATFVLAGPALAAKTTAITEKGAGTTKSTSEEGCQNGGTCTDELEGELRGTPIDNPRRNSKPKHPAGITGTLSADYSQAVINVGGTFTVPVTGDVKLTDRDGGRLTLEIDGEMTGSTTGGQEATLEGDFEVTNSGGKLRDVRGGSGTILADIVDEGETSTFTSTLEGTLERKGK